MKTVAEEFENSLKEEGKYLYVLDCKDVRTREVVQTVRQVLSKGKRLINRTKSVGNPLKKSKPSITQNITFKSYNKQKVASLKHD